MVCQKWYVQILELEDKENIIDIKLPEHMHKEL